MEYLFVILLLIASYVDIKKREIPNTICICIGIISLLNFHVLGILSALPFLICAMINPKNIGGGDIKLAASVGLFLGFWSAIYGIIIALSITTLLHFFHKIYTKISRQEEKRVAVPLAPFLTIGFLIVMYY